MASAQSNFEQLPKMDPQTAKALDVTTAGAVACIDSKIAARRFRRSRKRPTMK
jgi:hypothetical protein